MLSSAGGVKNVTVVRGLPGGLSEKCIAVARQIRFTPAELRGRKVTVVRTLVYNFSPD